MKSFDVNLPKGRIKGEMVGIDDVMREYKLLLEGLDLPASAQQEAIEAAAKDAREVMPGGEVFVKSGGASSKASGAGTAARQFARGMAELLAASRCAICGTEDRTVFEVAHIMPLASGGSDDPATSWCSAGIAT